MRDYNGNTVGNVSVDGGDCEDEDEDINDADPAGGDDGYDSDIID